MYHNGYIESLPVQLPEVEDKIKDYFANHYNHNDLTVNKKIICDDFKEYQITNQDKEFSRKSTIDEELVTKQEKNNSKKRKGKKNEQNSSHQETEEDIIVMQCPRDISRLSNIRKLLMGEWVDSNIVNCYMHLKNQTYTHVYTMNTQMNELLRSISF